MQYLEGLHGIMEALTVTKGLGRLGLYQWFLTSGDFASFPRTFDSYYWHFWTSLVAQVVKNPPAMQESPVRFLGQEDPLAKG